MGRTKGIIMIWDTIPNTRDVFITDVPGLGRYLIKRPVKGCRQFRLYLNNRGTSYFGTVDQLKKTVDRIIAQRIMVSNETR
jgi:hypothetical protein